MPSGGHRNLTETANGGGVSEPGGAFTREIGEGGFTGGMKSLEIKILKRSVLKWR
jgi:hypothetical protein